VPATGAPSQLAIALTSVNIAVMRVELTDEQEFLREAVAGTVARGATPALIREWAEAGDSGPADTLAERQGWTGIGLEEERGGQGGGIIELAVMAEELGRASVPWDRLLGAVLAQQLLGGVSSDEATALAEQTAEGEQVAVWLADGRRPPARWAEDTLSEGRLTLEADYVAGAPGAAHLVLAVSGGEGPRLLAVDAAGPGVAITPRSLVDHTRAMAAVSLESASAIDLGRIPEAAVARAGAAASVLVSADALGAAARMLELTTAYVADRRQFGVPVGSFQAVKHAAAEMLVAIEGTRAAVHYAAWSVAAGERGAPVDAWVAKARAARAATFVADKALFLHGAVGYTWEHDLQLLFKRAKSDGELFGAPALYEDRIADSLALVPDPELVGSS
jgi:alkylation response protein AidB-like acyl-CoA dehydrogenase